MLQEFRTFIQKGNVIDLAVAVIMGAAFGAIVTSLVGDIITPAVLNPVMSAVGAERLADLGFNGILYGNFLAAILNFLVVAFTMFLLVKAVNATKKPPKEVEKAPEIPAQEKLLMEIRDLLKKR